ncbi:MAG: hypothetical protein HZB83_04340 [Deltaproteobacteria bacterium]|nr:hypothetical protein [Deltaproteobacteria bacterium]
MAYIFMRAESRYWWVGNSLGGKHVQISLKVTARDAAPLLLIEHETLVAKELHQSSLLTIKRSIADAVKEYMENATHGKAVRG